jgi:ribonuclease HI
MTTKKKYYVVWEGHVPGVYGHWEECKKQTQGFEGAKYKSFTTKEEADRAYGENWSIHLRKQKVTQTSKTSPRPTGDFIAVDAACSGNPGLMEYRGVWRESGNVLFHQGPFPEGTNNIGEFLALVHALALQKSKQTRYPIYTDSANALVWLRKKKCKTTLKQTQANLPIFDLIDRAEHWLEHNEWDIPVRKWETSSWGEIPADFGRK